MFCENNTLMTSSNSSGEVIDTISFGRPFLVGPPWMDAYEVA